MSDDDGASESPTPDAFYFKRKKIARKLGNEEDEPESPDEEGEDVDPIEMGFAAAQEVAADMSADAVSAQWGWQHASVLSEGAVEESQEAQQLADREALIAAEFERITLKRQEAALTARDQTLGAADASAVISPTTTAGNSPISDARSSFMRDDLKRDRKTPPRVLRASPGASLSLTSPLSPDRPVPSVPSSSLLEPRVDLAYSPSSSSYHAGGSSAGPLGSPSFELGQRQPARPTAVQAAREAYSPTVERISDDSSLGSVEEMSSESSSSPPPPTADPLTPLAPEGDLAAVERACESPTLASLKATSLVARAKASLGNGSASSALPPSFGKEDAARKTSPSAKAGVPSLSRRWNQTEAQPVSAPPPKLPSASYFVSEDGLQKKPSPQQQVSSPQSAAVAATAAAAASAAANQASSRSPLNSRAAVRAVLGTDASSESPVRHHRSMFDLMAASPSTSEKGATTVASGASATDLDDSRADMFLDSLRTDEPSMLDGGGHRNDMNQPSRPSVRVTSALFERGRPTHKGPRRPGHLNGNATSDRVSSQRSKSDQFGRRNFQQPKQQQQLQQHQKYSPNGPATSSPGSNLSQSRNFNTTTNQKGPTSPRSPPPQPVGVLPEPRYFSPSRLGGILPTTAHARAAGASPAPTPPRPYRPTNSADFNLGGSSAPKRSPRVTAQENLRKLTPSTKARISYSDAFISRVLPGSKLTHRRPQQQQQQHEEKEECDFDNHAVSPETDANVEANAVEIGRQADVLWAALQKSVRGPPGGHATLGGYRFRDLDRDGNGRLSLEEFGDALVEAGLVSGIEWHWSSDHSAADGGPYDGTAAHSLVSGAVLSCVFAAADNDGDGTLDYLEFMHTLRQWGVFPSEVAVRRRAQATAKNASTTLPHRKDADSSLNSSRNVSFDLVNNTSTTSTNSSTPIRYRSASAISGTTRGRPSQKLPPSQQPSVQRPLPGQKHRRPAPSRALEKGPLWQQVDAREVALRAASEAEATARAHSRANSPMSANESGAKAYHVEAEERDDDGQPAANFSTSGSFLRDNLPSLSRPSQPAKKSKLKLPKGGAGRRARERTAAKVYDADGELVELQDEDEDGNAHNDENVMDGASGEEPSLFESSAFGFDNEPSNVSSSSTVNPGNRRRSTSGSAGGGGSGGGGSQGSTKRRAASQADMDALRRHLQAGLEPHTFASPSQERPATGRGSHHHDKQRRSESDLQLPSQREPNNNTNHNHEVAPTATRPAPSRPKQPNTRSAFPLFGNFNFNSNSNDNNRSSDPGGSSHHPLPARNAAWKRPSARSSSRSRPPPAFARATTATSSDAHCDNRGASEPRPFTDSAGASVVGPPTMNSSRPALRNTAGRYQQHSPPLQASSNEPMAASSAHPSLRESDLLRAPNRRSQSTPPLPPTPPPLSTTTANNTTAAAHAMSSFLPVDARNGFGHYQNELAATRAAVANRRAGTTGAQNDFAPVEKGKGLSRGRFVPIGTSSADDVAVAPPSSSVQVLRPQSMRRPRSADPLSGRWGPTPPPVPEGNSDEDEDDDDDDSTSSPGGNQRTTAAAPAPRARQRYEEEEEEGDHRNHSNEPSSAEVLALKAEVLRLQQLQAASEDEALRQRAEMNELRQSVADLRASATDFSGSGLRGTGGGGTGGFSSSGNWARASTDSSRASSLWATGHGGAGGGSGGKSGSGHNNASGVGSGGGGGGGDEFRDAWGDRDDFRATVMDFLNATLRTQRMSTPPPPTQQSHEPLTQQRQDGTGSPVDDTFTSREVGSASAPVAETVPPTAAAAVTTDAADTATQSAVASLAAQMALQAEEAQRAHDQELSELKASLASLRADVARFSLAKDNTSSNAAAAKKQSPTKAATNTSGSSTRHEAKAEQAAIERARAAENALAKAEQKVRLHESSAPVVGRLQARENGRKETTEEAEKPVVDETAAKEKAAREAAEAKASEAMAALEALRQEVANERAKREAMAANEERDRLRAEEHAKAVAAANKKQKEQARKAREQDQQQRQQRAEEAQQEALRRRKEEDAEVERLAQLEVERKAQQELHRKAEQKALRKAQREKAELDAQREAQRQAEIEAQRREHAEETNKARAARLAREQSAAREVAALKQLRAEAQATEQDLQRLKADAETQAREEAAQRVHIAAQVAAEREQHQREAAAAAAALAKLQKEALEASREASSLAEAEQEKCRSAVAEAAAAAEELAAFKASAAAAASEAIAAAERETAAMAATHSEALQAARMEAALAAQRSEQEREARAADQLALKEARAEVAAARAAAAQAAANQSAVAATRAALSAQEAEEQRAANDDLERRRLLEEAFASKSRREASRKKQSVTQDNVASPVAATTASGRPAYQPRASWDSVRFNKSSGGVAFAARTGLPPGWVKVKDPTTGKVYFIHRGTPGASAETSPNRGKTSPLSSAPLSAQQKAKESEAASEEATLVEVEATHTAEAAEPCKSNAPTAAASVAAVPVEASTAPLLDASPHPNSGTGQASAATTNTATATASKADGISSAPCRLPQTPSSSDNARDDGTPVPSAQSAMTSDPSATGSATNAAAVAVAAQRGENEAAEESAEQAWVSLARLAAKDKKGFLARFTQLDPNATGYLSAQLFGQVIEDAMIHASLLDQADKHDQEEEAAFVATPEVCALLMRTADPPGYKLLQQQAAQQRQLQGSTGKRVHAETAPQPHSSSSSSTSSSGFLALPSNIEYRKFVHAVNARSRSGLSTADWIAGQHAKAAHSSVLSPTKWGCAVCAKRNDEEHSACAGCGAERGRAVGNYMSAVKKAKGAHHHHAPASAGDAARAAQAGQIPRSSVSSASSGASSASESSPPSGNSPHHGAVSAPTPASLPAERALFLDDASGLIDAPSFDVSHLGGSARAANNHNKQGQLDVDEPSVSDLTVVDASMLLGPAPVNGSSSGNGNGSRGSSSNGDSATEKASGACNSYAVDVLAPSFGQCKCGHVKSAHGVHAFVASTPATSDPARAAPAATAVAGGDESNHPRAERDELAPTGEAEAEGLDLPEGSEPVDAGDVEAEVDDEENVAITFRASFGDGPIGMSFNQYEGGRWNLVVTRVEPDGAATLAGVAPGDLIAEVNGELLSAHVNEDDLFDMLVELPRPIEIGFLRLDELPDWELALEMSHHQYDDEEDDDDDDDGTCEGEAGQDGTDSEDERATGGDQVDAVAGSEEHEECDEEGGVLPEAPSATATAAGVTFSSPKSAHEDGGAATAAKVLPSVLRATPKSILRAHRSMANPQHGGNYAADSRDIGSMTGLMRSTQSPDQLSDVG